MAQLDDWFNIVTIGPAQPTLGLRQKAIEKLSGVIKAEEIPDIVRIYIGGSPLNSASMSKFLEVFQELDSGFSKFDNKFEVRILAAGLIEHILPLSNEVSDIAALALLCSDGLETYLPIIPNIRPLAESYLRTRSLALRETVAVPENVAVAPKTSTFAKLLQDNEKAAAETPIDSSKMTELATAYKQEVAQSNLLIRQSTQAAKACQLNGQKYWEDSRLLKLLLSQDYAEASNIDDENLEACILRISTSIAGITRKPLPHPQALHIIEEMLRRNRKLTSPTSLLALCNYIRSSKSEVNNVNADSPIVLDLCPILSNAREQAIGTAASQFQKGQARLLSNTILPDAAAYKLLLEMLFVSMFGGQ